MTPLPLALARKAFTYREASKAGVTQYELRKMLFEGALERIERGVYRITASDISDEVVFEGASKKLGQPCAVCLLSALSYYDLTDTIPRQVWLMVPDNKRTTSKTIKLFRARNPKWKVGILKEDGYQITNLERTIVDSLTHKRLLPPRVGLDALKRAIAEKKTSASKLLDMANALGVKKVALPYLEALT